MKAYKVSGSYIISKQNYLRREQPFNIEVAAKDEKDAEHTVISTIGSQHRIARKNVLISSITPLKKDQVTDHVVLHQLGGH